MLRVRGLSLRYPNGKLALLDFALTVEAGELVVVLGGNGSGKSTLLKCITRTLKPNAGEIWLGDTNLCVLEGEKLRRARLELAMIWQQASLVRRSSVLTNVATGALGRHSTLRTVFGGLPQSELAAARGYLGGFASEDYDLWIRLARSGARFMNLPDRLLEYRIHSDQSKGSRVAYAEVAGYWLRELLLTAKPRALLGFVVAACKSIWRGLAR